MSNSSQHDLIKNIMEYLRMIRNYSYIKKDKELKEHELDIASNQFFQLLYNNMQVFYTQYERKNINSEEQKFIFSEIFDILDIIYETDSNLFYGYDFVKSSLMYLIYSLKNPMNINIEIAVKIFLSFEKVIKRISNKKMDEYINKFEKDIVNTIKSLMNKCSGDYQINLDKFIKYQNLKEIMNYLDKYEDILPLYLKGFIEYCDQKNHRKYILIKIYKYFEIINPFKKDDLTYQIYNGYALYEICSYKIPSIINFNKFNIIKKNRIKNENVINILKSAIQFLDKETTFNNSKEIVNEENFKYTDYSPKISDIFDNVDEYYKDLENQLEFYLLKLSQNDITCTIMSKNIPRIMWLNFIQILLLNLSEDDIKRNEIKIIFYFIVNLFNPDIGNDSLEFKEDAISKLFYQCGIKDEILDHQEFYKLIDKEYAIFYPKFIKENTFKQSYFNLKNKEILKNQMIGIIRKDQIINMEINTILKCSKYLPFPLLQDYLKTINKKIEVKEYSLP